MSISKSISKFSIYLLALSCSLYFLGCSEDKVEEVVKDQSATIYSTSSDGKTVRVKDLGKGTGTMKWTADKTYILDNFVFVNEGQLLTIEPGTVIKGKAGQNTDAAALIVARGGKIDAQGTPEKPIIFTAEADDVTNPNQPEDTQRGLWGGLVILGKAVINPNVGEKTIEGIPTTEKRALYGGKDDGDNSGIIKYVSVRHGGTTIATGNEINGITFGAVGSGTIVEHIEAVHTADDGVEIFGGAVRIKYLVSAFNDDDAIDYDEGYHGYIQHGFVWQSNSPKVGDNGGEFDGGTTPIDGLPYSKPTIANVTFVGGGRDSTTRRAMILRDNAGGFIHNSIFTEWGKGIEVEDIDEAISKEDSYNRLKVGDMAFQGNIFWNVAGNDTNKFIRRLDTKNKTTPSLYQEAFVKGGNQGGDPGIVVSYSQDNRCNPIPVGGGVSLNVKTVDDSWFDKSSYRGGFQPGNSNHWLKGWSYLANHKYLAQ